MTTTTTNTYAAGALDLRGTIAKTIRGWLKAYDLHRRYRRTYAELSYLSTAELEDLGMSRWQLDDIARKAVYGK
ncbi:MAG: DUF1127 domain-containing protein [Pseudomonadota bacterium]